MIQERAIYFILLQQCVAAINARRLIQLMHLIHILENMCNF